jgi:hypothetical protein
MPRIANPEVLKILEHPYFDHHVSMHLGRERLIVPGRDPEPLFLPDASCKDCAHMTEVGKPGSGKEFLQMHHEMIRVFRFLLEQQGMELLACWQNGYWHSVREPDKEYYAPSLWDLDECHNLPREITGMFIVTDPEFLGLVFDGVRKLNGRQPTIDCGKIDDCVDNLGRFIERGIDRSTYPEQPVDGSGFHNTIHEFLAAREGKSASGAEMNRLRNSMFNDHFWSLHLWIDGQYGRLLERCGKEFNTEGLSPDHTDMMTHSDPHGMATGMSMPNMP